MATSTCPDITTLPLATLVGAAQAGDRRAFGELFERYHAHVLAVALRRLRNHDEAQELCQDVFVQALQKIGQLRQPACFGAWLRSITTRLAINRRVRQRQGVAVEREAFDAQCVDAQTPLTAALEGEQQTQVRDGLRQLKALDRETLEAFYVQGRSLHEMSDLFDAPLGTIKRRLHVARLRLARHMDRCVAV